MKNFTTDNNLMEIIIESPFDLNKKSYGVTDKALLTQPDKIEIICKIAGIEYDFSFPDIIGDDKIDWIHRINDTNGNVWKLTFKAHSLITLY